MIPCSHIGSHYLRIVRVKTIDVNDVNLTFISHPLVVNKLLALHSTDELEHSKIHFIHPSEAVLKNIESSTSSSSRAKIEMNYLKKK